MKAKAAVFMGANTDFEVREFEVTKTPAGYGRSTLIASGICGTDIHFHKGTLAIGAPTINQHFPPGFFLPGFGVYASVAYVDGQAHAAVTNIGVRPTVGSPEPLSETYIHDFDGNLYEQTVEVRLVSFLRPERRFPSVEALRAAIAQDARRSLEIFNSGKEKYPKTGATE